jgi:hypothetical protein
LRQSILTWISLGSVEDGYTLASRSRKDGFMGNPAGLAVLSICESLLLALTEAGIIDDNEARGLLEDAAVTHHNAAGLVDGAANHLEAAAIIERMLAGRDPMLP